MKRNFTIILCASLLLAIYSVGGCIFVLDRNISQIMSNDSIDPANALETTKEWARLSEIPPNATDLKLENLGSSFTREFVVTFKLPTADLERWLEESPGTKGVVPTLKNGVRKYSIKPGGGSQHAELEFNESEETVRINVYWS